MTRWWWRRFTDHQVKLTEGSYRNLKVTTPEDLPLAEKISAQLKDLDMFF